MPFYVRSPPLKNLCLMHVIAKVGCTPWFYPYPPLPYLSLKISLTISLQLLHSLFLSYQMVHSQTYSSPSNSYLFFSCFIYAFFFNQNIKQLHLAATYQSIGCQNFSIAQSCALNIIVKKLSFILKFTQININLQIKHTHTRGLNIFFFCLNFMEEAS